MGNCSKPEDTGGNWGELVGIGLNWGEIGELGGTGGTGGKLMETGGNWGGTDGHLWKWRETGELVETEETCGNRGGLWELRGNSWEPQATVGTRGNFGNWLETGWIWWEIGGTGGRQELGETGELEETGVNSGKLVGN